MSSTDADQSIGIDRLYKNYEILSEAKEKITEHEAEYREILDAIKGSAKEKRLASQFIGKFFKYFPNLTETAIDAQLDLCEDEDIQIRRQAIKDLPQLCKDSKDNTAKIGDILAQLLVVEDASELTQVHLSLQTLAKYDAKGTLAGIFSQILTGDEATRSSCFKFVQTKFRNLGSDVVTKEVEEFMISEIKKILQDVTADEFHICMTILGATKLGSSISGHNELVSLAVEQAELDGNIDPIAIEDEVVERYIQCANHALPYFSSKVDSTKFLAFMCEKFLPLTTWNIIGATEQQDQMQLRLLKVFAEMCKYSGQLEKAAEKVEAIFNVLQEYMPLPPFDSEVIDENPSFQFSHAECLLYALHTLGKQCPVFFAFSNEPTKLKEFRSRLQYLARGTQGCVFYFFCWCACR
ncbi:Apoptosis inhibitor 5 like [Pseudolycoriella hygida]|uniref:Apoptosis inhibitor 5 like n=1 Tax=Pseudolycoriella hygida TaxID=35572 RepID=A0A9Q0S702_9DIPT|nr:Apoptosis inhibitor 5 like [Pseudolycoriella hygida]